jgi:sortase A
VGRLRAGIALALVLVGSVALAYPVLAYGLNGDRTRRLTAAVEAAIRSSQAANRARAGSNLVSGGVRARAPDRRARSEESEPAPADEGRAGGRPILEVPAPRGGQALGVIQIPAIGLHTVFLEGTADATLLVGPGHLPWTSMPGTGGVSVLAAHRDLQFSNLHDVDFGDRIWLELPSGTVTYKVVDVHVTTPRDGRIYAADPGRPTELRLLTCWPPSFIGPAPDRLVVSAVPVAAAPAPAPVLPTPAAASPEAESPAAASSPAALASDEPPRAMAGGSRVHLPAAPTSVGAELVPMLGAAGVGLSSLASFARVQGRRRRAWFVAFLVGALALDVALVIGLAA